MIPFTRNKTKPQNLDMNTDVCKGTKQSLEIHTSNHLSLLSPGRRARWVNNKMDLYFFLILFVFFDDVVVYNS